MIGVSLEPVDTWFFRDSTPFTRGAAPQDNVDSLFPPYPATTVGALRVALALARDWDGRGRWCDSLNDILGNGPEDLGKLSFNGPFLLRDGKPLFPSPCHLLGERGANGWRPCALLRPGPPVQCDLGKAVCLPDLPEMGKSTAKLQTGDREWLTVKGLKSVLNGALPETGEIIPDKALWSVEEHIGLERDRDTRNAKEGMLYSIRQVRPMHGVSLGVRIAGLPADWTGPFGRLVPLGGESRMAQCREWKGCPDLDTLSISAGPDKRVTLVALSPLDLKDTVIRGEQPLDALGGSRVVSACLERPQSIGGWNSLDHRPLPLRSVLAPGSVLFCCTQENRLDTTIHGGLLRIGARTAWGFGLVAMGAWPDDLEREL